MIIFNYKSRGKTLWSIYKLSAGSNSMAYVYFQNYEIFNKILV